MPPPATLLPSLAVAAAVGSVTMVVAGVLPVATGLAATIAALLVVLVILGERPLLDAGQQPRARALGAALAVVWLLACYLPFHVRIFPGTPLLEGAALGTTGQGLPLRIPAAGHGAIDLVLQGKLVPSPTGGTAIPVHFRLTLEGSGGAARTVEGTFEDTLRTRRLGRRGTAVVHQTHTADVRVIPNPGRGDVTVTGLVLEPEGAGPITLTAFAHPLPSPVVLVFATVALLGGVMAFDRFGPAPETDGALTLATAATLGTAVIFWTSNAVRPDFQTLIGSAIFGGPLGFGAGALLWWVAKHLIVRSTR